ncbi:MAG: TetR/AcrR family transcriptional regulator [Desulfobacteraceae bacterium]|jgi:AcrR family transcriptional regulator|nr:MAG: TetR/AcrR family transcriptional regulator [Desulfobacteraceae bacterium]
MNESKRELTVLDQIKASQEVRKAIIDAASTLYARKGFAATSIQEIAEAAGVSLPVTHHYVKSKSEIMRLIMEDVLKAFRESLTRETVGITDPEERLAIAFIIYARVVDRHKDQLLLLYQKSGSLDRPSRTRIMQLEVEVSEIFGEIITQGIGQGVFRPVDVDLMAYNIMLMTHMWVLKGWHFKKRLDLEKYADLQLKTIIHSLKHEEQDRQII